MIALNQLPQPTQDAVTATREQACAVLCAL